MESNVCQLIAQVAALVSNLFASSRNQNETNNGGASQNAPESVVDSISISKNVTDLVVARNPTWATADALFGEMKYNGTFIGYTMERTAVQIPAGTYPACMETSPHFGFATPHLTVPGRTYIEIHPANYPLQLEGCIAVGTTIDHDTLDNSRAAFDRMMSTVPDSFQVTVS